MEVQPGIELAGVLPGKPPPFAAAPPPPAPVPSASLGEGGAHGLVTSWQARADCMLPGNARRPLIPWVIGPAAVTTAALLIDARDANFDP